MTRNEKEMIAKCKSNPGELAASPNCINAQQAQNEKDLSRRGYLKLPPVDFNKKGE
ncbi:plasmid-related lipoprotein [Xanthomonas arboricola pv. pruni str. MAFF 311562]|uniref:Plasmid-related lipoprotein n=1 Tax=Xanthomonas arboricola pv. pruni str. MAFF 311562 TaxID=1414836 RepID=W4RZU1_9XANT|nr:plasmid-related lipoprotein [Xanthomonas arboricola pv. pruni str. MAFF 311562]